MKKTALGNTGIAVSEIAFGTVSIGRPYGIGVRGTDDLLPESKAVALLQTALDRGINFFDTARAYGCSEDRLGQAFRDRRDEVVLGTKCTHLYDENAPLATDQALRSTMDHSLAASLAALQTDYVDVFMLHDSRPEVVCNPVVLDALAGYRSEGKVRALGVSTYTVDETRAAIESGVWGVVQLAYNLLDQRQAEMFPLAARHGVGIMVRSVLLKGVLTDRARHLHPALKSVEEHRSLYEELLSEAAPTLSELATRFVLSQEDVSCVLLGIDQQEYLNQALAVADGRILDSTTLARARQLAYPDPDFIDLPAWDKHGWLT